MANNNSLVDQLVAQFTAQQARANAANEKRYEQGLQIFDRIISGFDTGGTFEAATEAALGRAQTKAVAQGTQALVSSGLAGTTQAAGLGKKFEEEIGAPTRLQAADIAQQRLSEALGQKAGFIERREDIGPSFSEIAQLAMSIGQGQQSGRVSSNIRGGGGSGFDELSRLQAQASARGAASQAASDLAMERQKADIRSRADASRRALAERQARQKAEKKPRLDIKFAAPIVGVGQKKPAPFSPLSLFPKALQEVVSATRSF